MLKLLIPILAYLLYIIILAFLYYRSSMTLALVLISRLKFIKEITTKTQYLLRIYSGSPDRRYFFLIIAFSMLLINIIVFRIFLTRPSLGTRKTKC